jgi:hypothetical protein
MIDATSWSADDEIELKDEHGGTHAPPFVKGQGRPACVHHWI